MIISMKTPTFIAIGDTVTDDFIALKDAHVNCRIDTETCEISMRFGDKVPYESLETIFAVGNAANAAVAAKRLGLESYLVSNIGGDYLGEKMLEHLSAENVHTSLIRVHEDKRSNHHFVLLYEGERTILIKHEAYDYALPKFDAPEWIYLSSLGDHTESFHGLIADYLEANPDVKLAFQPGTFQIKLGREKLARIFARTEIFFCNKDEAKHILSSESHDVRELSKALADLGPKIVCLTDGPNGAYMYEKENDTLLQTPMYPDPAKPVDRTGAGDAFASTVVVALAFGLSLSEALSWGPVNSMSVVQEIGAQKGLLTREKLETYLKDAPKDYNVEKVS